MIRAAEWELSSDTLRVRVGARGAEIRSIVHLASGAELLWSRAAGEPGAPPTAMDASEVEFYEQYTGGIQELFPNAGPGGEVAGGGLVFHGESCRIPWSVEEVDGGLLCEGRLTGHPFSLRRQISLSSDGDQVIVLSSVTNESAGALPVHWGLHPAFSEQLTAAPATLTGPFLSMSADPSPFGAAQRWAPGSDIALRRVPGGASLTLTPGEAACADLAYAVVDDGWYVLASERTGFAVGVTWPVDIFPRVWLWQQCHEPAGYPWWGRHHIVGVEPQSSAPARSLADDVDAGGAIVVGAGETRQARFGIRVSRGGEPAAFLAQVQHDSEEKI